MMIHPPGVNLASMPCICVAEVEVVYHGKSAHASAMPHKGFNASGRIATRLPGDLQPAPAHPSTERIHGIITEGGAAPNIVPDRTVRAVLRAGREREGARQAETSCASLFRSRRHGQRLRGRGELGQRRLPRPQHQLAARGSVPDARRIAGPRFVLRGRAEFGAGSTDMGNVSYRVPSIHPMLAVAPPNVVIHNPEFANWAVSRQGDAAATRWRQGAGADDGRLPALACATGPGEERLRHLSRPDLIASGVRNTPRDDTRQRHSRPALDLRLWLVDLETRHGLPAGPPGPPRRL